MANNITERLVAIWSRENPLFPVYRKHEQDINSTSIYECGIVLFLGGGVSCVFSFLHDRRFPRGLCFRHLNSKFASPDPRMALLLQRECCFSREGWPQELAQQLSAPSV